MGIGATAVALVPLVLAALALLLPTASVQAQGSAADSVRALDAAWARSYATHDVALAGQVFADDIAITSSQGTRKTKADELRDVAPAAGAEVAYFRSVNVEVRMHAGTGIVTGILEWELTYNGRTSAVRRTYTATWVRGGPLGWRMVALHIGPAPAATGG